MAEAALFGIAKSGLQQLASPALDEFRLLWGYKEHLDKLEDTVTTINNVLQDADRKQVADVAVQGWLAQLRVVLYEAEDLFDAISAQVLLEKGTQIRKKVRHFASKPYRLAKNAHKVKQIRERFDDIARNISGFNFLPNQTNLAPRCRIGRDPTHSFVPSNEVVGREKEREGLVRMLLPDCSQQQKGVYVIAVIGIGGLGKTTLAQLVYNDDRVQKGFDLCMWACINYFSDLKQVVITLLKSATKKEPENLDIDQLQSLFREEIQGKRFLLVLDDVWDEDHQNWRKLKDLLSCGKDGSKVLTTTRSEIVAQSLCATKPYFDLKGMSDESALLLFKKVAFGEEDDQNGSEFEDIGQQIVKECANVPLAIVTIASLLREKEKERWSLVTGELSKIFPDGHANIMKVLEFSYKELPYQVKRCFGYCSLFPKDYKFKKDSLVCLWIAQGFVEPLGNESLEDKAEEYLLYLVKRCFFQLAIGGGDDDRETRGIVAYQMHDLMHDLAMKVAGSECILVDKSEGRSWVKTVHHVSMNCESHSVVVDRVCSFYHSKSLRTFLNHSRNWLENDALKKLMLAFGSLRVLDLSRMGIKEVPTSIGGLIHLRFLNLSGNSRMTKLPSSICNLPHLQYLNLQYCYGLKELPKEMGGLLSLRHLMLQGCHSLIKMPPGLAALTSLVTLDKLVVHYPSGGLRYLERLDNLTGSLQIVLPRFKWQNATTDLEISSLSRKTRLHSLVILNEIDDEIDYLPFSFMDLCSNHFKLPPNLQDLSIERFGDEKILNGISSLHKLVILKLEGCKCVVLPSLSHLPSLRELWISWMDSLLTVEDSNVYERSLFFPSLETLSIKFMLNLKNWWPEAPTVLPTFPRLKKVDIRDCLRLTGCMPLFPTIVEDLSLEEVGGGEIIQQIIGSEGASSTSDDKAGEICIAEVRRTHFLRLRRLVIPTINRNLFKGLKDLAFLEVLEISYNFNAELQEEDEKEEGIRWKDLNKLSFVGLEFGEGFSMRNNPRLLNGFLHLTSLNVLSLRKCKELYLSWRALLSLPNLQDVRIEHVEEVIDFDSDAKMNHTQPISRSIRQLSINQCSGEWVHDIPWKSLPSLEYLYLAGFRNLKSLPEGIQHLTALAKLSMDLSSELEKRCERGKGEDWPIIQHIPEIWGI